MTWMAQAETLAEDAREYGTLAAVIHAAALSAGVDPQAARGLAGAGLALGAGLSVLMSPAEPLFEDRQMTGYAADIEGDVADLRTRARDLDAKVRTALESACDAAASAQQMYQSAEAGAGQDAAREAIASARRAIADCEAALDISGDLAARLDYARTCLERVPGDLLTTYEVPYDHIRSGGRLPFHGDFLTEETAAVTEEGAA